MEVEHLVMEVTVSFRLPVPPIEGMMMTKKILDPLEETTALVAVDVLRLVKIILVETNVMEIGKILLVVVASLRTPVLPLPGMMIPEPSVEMMAPVVAGA